GPDAAGRPGFDGPGAAAGLAAGVVAAAVRGGDGGFPVVVGLLRPEMVCAAGRRGRGGRTAPLTAHTERFGRRSNRRGVANARVVPGRPSQPPGPRVMR